MPDALITACHQLDGVQVHWISRYNAGASLSMDLEAVETFTQEPAKALEHLVSVVPPTFRTDWAMVLVRVDGELETMHGSPAAPTLKGGGVVEAATSWLALRTSRTVPGLAAWDSTLLAVSPGRLRGGTKFVVVVGRHGGPDFLSSEIARLGHMVSLAAGVQTS
jgi:hypothetical protein